MTDYINGIHRVSGEEMQNTCRIYCQVMHWYHHMAEQTGQDVSEKDEGLLQDYAFNIAVKNAMEGKKILDPETLPSVFISHSESSILDTLQRIINKPKE